MTSHTPANQNIYKDSKRSNNNKEEKMRNKTFLKSMFLITMFMTLILFFSIFSFAVFAQPINPNNTDDYNIQIKSPENIDTLINGKLRYTDSVNNPEGLVTQNERLCFDTDIGDTINGRIKFSSDTSFMIKKEPLNWNSEKYIYDQPVLKEVIMAPDLTSNTAFSFISPYERFCIYMWGSDDKIIEYTLEVKNE